MRDALSDDAAAERYFGDALRIWHTLDAALDIPDTKRGPAVVLIRLVGLAERRGDRALGLQLATDGERLTQEYAGLVGDDLPDARALSGWFREALQRLQG